MKKSSKIDVLHLNIRTLTVMVYFLFTAVSSLSAQTADKQEQFSQLLCIDYQGYVFQASSTLESSQYPYLGEYGMQTLFDGDQYTGWSEGVSGDGKGEVLWLQIDEESDTLLLKNGFARSADLFYKNNRVRSFRVSLWAGYLPAGMVTEYGPHYVIASVDQHHTLPLRDERAVQEHRLYFDYEAAREKQEALKDRFSEYAEKEDLPPMIEKSVFLLQMEITGVYPGNRWDDTCLTELRCFDSRNFKPGEVESLEGAVRYRSEDGRWRFLYAEKELLFDPYLLSPDGRWCVSFTAPKSSEGRVETGYALFHLPYPELHKHERFEEKIEAGRMPIEFKVDDHGVALMFDDGSKIILE